MDTPRQSDSHSRLNQPRLRLFAYAGCRIRCSLRPGQAHKIVRGEAGAPPALHIVKQWESVAEMSLYPAPDFATGDRNAATAGGIGTFYMVTRETKLSIILREFEGHTLHWMACMARFNSKDTTEGGFNADFPV